MNEGGNDDEQGDWRRKGRIKRKEMNQSNIRARAGNHSVNSSYSIENLKYFEGRMHGE